MGAGAAGQKLLDGDDVLAFGVPFAEIPKRLGHLTQRIAAVDDRGDLPGLAELQRGARCCASSRTAKRRTFLSSALPINGSISRTSRSVVTDPVAYR